MVDGYEAQLVHVRIQQAASNYPVSRVVENEMLQQSPPPTDLLPLITQVYAVLTWYESSFFLPMMNTKVMWYESI